MAPRKTLVNFLSFGDSWDGVGTVVSGNWGSITVSTMVSVSVKSVSTISGNWGRSDGYWGSYWFDVYVWFSSDFLVDVWFSSDFFMYVWFGSDFFVYVGFGSDFFMYIGFGS